MYKMIWLPSNSLISVINQDSSSFQVYMAVSHFLLMCMYKILQLKLLAKKVLRRLWYWCCENVKKTSVLGWKNFAIKWKCVFQKQFMLWDTCDCMCTCPHTCQIPCTSEKSPVPTSLSTLQSHMPNRSFIVATATLVTVTFCFQNSAVLCFIQNETF